MKKTVFLLLALLPAICLMSCAVPAGDGSSAPAASELPSLPTVSSETSRPESSDTTSSTQSSSDQSSGQPTSSDTPSESVFDSSYSSSTPSVTEPDAGPAPVSKEEYHYYKNLSRYQKEAYDRMLLSVDGMPSAYIPLGSSENITERDVYLAAVALKSDHPEIFWLPYAWYIGETHTGEMAILFVNKLGDEKGDIESYEATYIVGRGDKQRMQAELSAKVAEIKRKVTATDPYEIELQLHDIICDTASYSASPTPLSYTAYGALVKGDAVCEGYTRAMQLLLLEFGINSTVVTGDAGGPHMWNLVQIEGKWYHLDLTWDDLDGERRHEYFNLTDAGISRDHTVHTEYEYLTKDEVLSGVSFNFKLPVCNSTEQYYFIKTGFTYEQNAKKLADIILAPDFEGIEVIGFGDEAKNALTAELDRANGGVNIHFETDGYWAYITLKQ